MPRFIVPVEVCIEVPAVSAKDAEKTATALIWDFIPGVDTTCIAEGASYELKEEKPISSYDKEDIGRQIERLWMEV